MKISQKQASLLAKEIVNQLSSKGLMKVSESIKNQIRAWKKKREQFMVAEREAEEARKKYDSTLNDIIGKCPNVYPYDNLEKICDKLEQKNLPSVSEIEDEIILKSMFKSEDDMETFVNSIVKKYEKKLQRKVLAN